jgi:UDP-3-O-[3-hydroxymyristoyl] glucosamine N-acyltransferase
MRFLERVLLALAMLLPMPPIKRSLYRMSGAHIGRHVYVSPNVVINCTDMRQSRIEDNCSLGLGVWIRCKSIVMEQGVKIAGGAFIVGKETVSIGKGAYIGQNAFLDCWEAIVLENYVQISPGAMILTQKKYFQDPRHLEKIHTSGLAP